MNVVLYIQGSDIYKLDCYDIMLILYVSNYLLTFWGRDHAAPCLLCEPFVDVWGRGWVSLARLQQ